MNLLYIVFGDNIEKNGIIETQVFNFLSEITGKHGVEKSVIVNITNVNSVGYKDNLKIYKIDNRSLNTTLKRVEDICKEESINLIHCRSYYSGFIGAKLKKRRKIPFIFDLRGKFPQENYLFRLDSGEMDIDEAKNILKRDLSMEREILGNSLYNIVMNNYYKNYISNIYNLNNIEVISNFTPKHNLSNGWRKNRFLYSGNLNSAWIDFDILIEWIKDIEKIKGTTIFILYGITDEEKEGLKTILSHIIKEGSYEIYISPNRERYNEIISSCEFGLIPHKKFYREILDIAQPLKYLDYISFGLKLIATPYCLEIIDFIREYRAGIVTEKGFDIENSYISSNYKIQQYANEKFTGEDSEKKIISLYKKSLKIPTAYIIYNEDIALSGIINSQLLPLLEYITKNSNYYPTIISIIPLDYKIDNEKVEKIKNSYDFDIKIFREDNNLKLKLKNFIKSKDFKLLHFRSYMGFRFIDNSGIKTIFDTRSILPIEERLKAKNRGDYLESETIYKYYLDIEKSNIERSDRVIAVNSLISDYFNKRYNIKIDTIELFSSERNVPETNKVLRERLNISEDRVIILFSGAVQTPWYSLEKIFLWYKLLEKYNPVLIIQNYINNSRLDSLRKFVYSFGESLNIDRENILLNPPNMSYAEILKISNIGLIPFDEKYKESLYYASSSKLYDYLKFSLYVLVPDYSQFINNYLSLNPQKGEVISSKIDYIKLERAIFNKKSSCNKEFSLENGGECYLKIYNELLEIEGMSLNSLNGEKESCVMEPIKYRSYSEKDIEKSVNKFIDFLNNEMNSELNNKDKSDSNSQYIDSIFDSFKEDNLSSDKKSDDYTKSIFNIFSEENKEEEESNHSKNIFDMFKEENEEKKDHSDNIFNLFK
ncbi:MAG: hypothetical protein CR982_01095 [Candidatus Cloacimonadota bacterium]|nr:MAG: hypothetical protein CR982_01095 [Candidatus Cloacimonadota bacterium]PIE78132.1 MAG: hypothetical protein CSA15_09415 [Candidatus Delongbacteria bacterium]